MEAGVMEAGGGGGKGEDKGGYENDEGEGDTFVSYGSDADIADKAVGCRPAAASTSGSRVRGIGGEADGGAMDDGEGDEWGDECESGESDSATSETATSSALTGGSVVGHRREGAAYHLHFDTTISRSGSNRPMMGGQGGD